MTPVEPPQSWDSLEIVELQMPLEEIRSGELTPPVRAERIRRLRARLAQFDLPPELWNRPAGGDDDLPAALVRNRGPRRPVGKPAAPVHPPTSSRTGSPNQ